MTIRQLSVFVENKPGKISSVVKLISDAGLDIRALSVADTQDFGVLRLIVNDTKKAIDILRNEGFVVSGTEILAVRVADTPGGLANLLETIEKCAINLEYMYAIFTKERDYCYMALRVEDVKKAADLLDTHGYKTASAEDLAIS